MMEGLSMNASSNRMTHLAKEKEEKRALERRKNLLHLIAEFLWENGYAETCELFVKEARLPLDVEICDNVDLDAILLEYFDYFFAKYGKFPKICKKGEPSFVSALVKREKIREHKANKKTIAKTDDAGSSDNDTPMLKKNHNDNKYDSNLNITVTQLVPPDNSTPNNETKTLDLRDVKYLKPLGNIYPLGSEWREIADVIMKEVVLKNLNVRWNDVKGLDDCKNLLKEAAVYPIKYSYMFNERLTPWRGVLLYGPPGTGKTMLAKAVATECSATFFNITSSSLISKWRGESEKYVRVLLDLAKFHAPSIVFIDEVDWTVGGWCNDSSSKSEPSRRFRAELLARLDGLLSMEGGNVLLLAASNVPWDLDTALLRRLEKQIYVGLPDYDARHEILKSYFKPNLLDTNEYKNIVITTRGYSCADLKLLCREAWMIQLRPVWSYLENLKLTLKEYNNDGISSLNHVKEAMTTIKPLAQKRESRYVEWEKSFFEKEDSLPELNQETEDYDCESNDRDD